MNNIVNDVGTGIATYERIKAVLSIFIFIIILGILIFVAYDSYKDDHTAKTQATINGVNCSPVTNTNPPQYNCSLQVSYSVNNKTYNTTLVILSEQSFVIGEQIEINYNPQNPSDVVYGISSKTLAYILFAIIPIMTISFVAYIYFVFKSKTFATAAGVADISTTIIGKL